MALEEEYNKDEFVLEYRKALFWNTTYENIEDVRNLICSILSWEKKNDNSDPLIVFLNKCLDDGTPLNRLTWEELSEAFEIKIPWVKILSDSMYVDEDLSKVLDWKKYVEWKRMLFFTNWKMLYCDISSCDKWVLPNSNGNAIRIVKNFLEEFKWSTEMTPKEILDSIISQCRGLNCDYED